MSNVTNIVVTYINLIHISHNVKPNECEYIYGIGIHNIRYIYKYKTCISFILGM